MVLEPIIFIQIKIYTTHQQENPFGFSTIFHFLKDSKLARLFVNIWSVEAQPSESLQNGSPQQKSARE